MAWHSIRTTWPAQIIRRAAKLARIRSRERMAELHRLDPVAADAVDRSRPVRLILHIGLHRTGSTSVQIALGAHYEQLLSSGILYPVGIFPDRQHSSIFKVANKGSGADIARFFLSLRHLANRSGCRSVILSGEMISLLKEERLVRMREALAACNFETLVVGFVRPPLRLLRSRISQWMISYPKRFVTPFSLAEATRDYEVDTIRRTFLQVFGADRVVLRELGQGDDAVQLFAQLAGIELPAGIRRNTSADFAVMSFVNAIKADFELSPASIHSAYEGAFGNGRSRFTNEERFIRELLLHSDPTMRAEIEAGLAKSDKAPAAEWTHEEQVRYLRRFETFVRHLRRDHAWAIKGRVRGRKARMEQGLARLGIDRSN